jgi:hypothetical protein
MVALCLHVIAITKTAFRQCCPIIYRLNGYNMYARNFLIKDLGVRMVLPCRSDGCKLSSQFVSAKTAGIFSNFEEHPDVLP